MMCKYNKPQDHPVGTEMGNTEAKRLWGLFVCFGFCLVGLGFFCLVGLVLFGGGGVFSINSTRVR